MSETIYSLKEELKALKRELTDKTAALNKLRMTDSVEENRLLGKAFTELDKQHQTALVELDDAKAALAEARGRIAVLDKQLRLAEQEGEDFKDRTGGSSGASKTLAEFERNWKEREAAVAASEKETVETVRRAHLATQEWRHRCLKEMDRVKDLTDTLTACREETLNHAKYIAKLEEQRLVPSFKMSGPPTIDQGMRDRVLEMHRQVSEATQRLFAESQRVSALEEMRLQDIRKIAHLESRMDCKN